RVAVEAGVNRGRDVARADAAEDVVAADVKDAVPTGAVAPVTRAPVAEEGPAAVGRAGGVVPAVAGALAPAVLVIGVRAVAPGDGGLVEPLVAVLLPEGGAVQAGGDPLAGLAHPHRGQDLGGGGLVAEADVDGEGAGVGVDVAAADAEGAVGAQHV